MFKSLNTLKKSKSIKKLNISEPVMQSEQQLNIPPLPTSTTHTSTSSFQSNASSNLSSTPRTTPSSNTVILITKFDFKAEHQNEITVGVGEALKLIERKGNGWILVKPIGRVSAPGLIPASYVRIVRLNNKNNSSDSTLNSTWLASNESKANKSKCSSVDSSVSSDQEQHFSFQSTTVSRPSSPNSIISTKSTHLESPTPVSGLVRNASCYNGRYWYRVDIDLTDGKRRHLCRYYQDFYKLHCSIVEAIRNNYESSEEQDSNISKLPGLPDPIPRPDLETLSSILLQRCQSLNVYIFKIVQNKYKINYNGVLEEWCLPRLGDLESDPKNPMSNESIEQQLNPLPTTINKTKKKPSLSIQTSVTPPLPAPELPPNSILSKNSYINSVSPVSSPVSSPKIWASPNTPSSSTFRERSSSTVASTPKSGLFKSSYEDNWMSSPTEPLFSNTNSREKFVNKRVESVSSTISNAEFVKIKIFHNDDIFAVRFNRCSKLQDLKASISKRLECDMQLIKLYYKNSSKNYFSPLSDEFDLHSALEQPKVSIKVHLW